MNIVDSPPLNADDYVHEALYRVYTCRDRVVEATAGIEASAVHLHPRLAADIIDELIGCITDVTFSLSAALKASAGDVSPTASA